MVLAPHPNPDSPVLSHFSLDGKTALVTGGSRGIGLEVVRGLVEAGAKVAFTYSSTPPAEADKLAADISAANNGRAVVAEIRQALNEDPRHLFPVVAEEGPRWSRRCGLVAVAVSVGGGAIRVARGGVLVPLPVSVRKGCGVG